MVDTPSALLLLRLQSTGSNTNLWGGYLNTGLQTLEQAAKGFQTLEVAGHAVVAWTNYATGNIGQAARLKLTGALVSGAVLTFPAYQNFLSVENTAGAAVTIKCAGGTGVVLANGQTADLYCDGTDYKNAGSTRLGIGDVAVTGKINGLTAGAAATDAVNKAQMETAIATAGLPATAGTVLASSGDTTAGYMSQKIAVAGDLAVSIQNAGGDEDVLVTHAPYWNVSRVVADTDSPVAALDRDVLLVRTLTGAVEVDLPSEGRVKIVDVDGAASANNIAVDPPGSDTIGFDVVDTDYFEGIWQRRPSGTNWDLI